MLSRAAYSVAIPLYSALITEVSPYFSDQTVSFDHCKQTDVVYNEEPENSINYVLMDISSLCFENPDTLGISVRAYLDALQNELIEQNKEVDAAMLAETTTEAALPWPTRPARLLPRTPTRSARPCSRRCAPIRRPKTSTSPSPRAT